MKVNLEELNFNTLEVLGAEHRTYFMTGMLSDRLDQADLLEVVRYAYGTLAGQVETEEYRAEFDVKDHEGFDDCEVSPHFWRGVCDVRGTFFLSENRKPRKRTDLTGYSYPIFRVNGTQLLLSRLYDFFKLYSPYPKAASDKFLAAIDEEKGKVELIGQTAQMAVYNLYHCAHVGAMMSRAEDILNWQPLTGQSLGSMFCQPRRLDLSKLKPMPV